MVSVNSFKDQLKRQLGFLGRSCASFDSGFRDEAIRIAVIARVLVHDTGKSTSLLTHLGAKGIKLLSTCKPVLEPPRVLVFDGLTSFCGGTFVPKLDRGTQRAEISASDWWNQLVLVVRDSRFTRSRLITTAANKDGGAHVDPKLDKDYKDYLEIVQNFWTLMGPEPGANTLYTETHFLSLRQIGYELLHSPELLFLAV